MKPKSLTYEKLELIFNPAQKYSSNKQKFSLWLVNIWKFLAKALFQTNRLQIWQETNCQGDTCWKVHDTATGQTAYCSTELEVRIWIEQRYSSYSRQPASTDHKFISRR